MRRFVTVGVFSLATVLYGACSDDGSDGGIGGNGGGGGTGGGAGAGASAGQAGDAGAGNIAGGGGTAGQGGTAGAAGTGGSAGSAGTAGVGGNDPDAGDGGILESDSGVGDGGLGDASLAPPCTGCLELRAPLAAPGDFAYFQLGFSGDLTNTVATFRLRSLALDESGQTQFQLFATSFNGTDYIQGNGTAIVNNAATFTPADTFVDFTLTFGTISTSNGFDPATVVAFGIQPFAGGSFTGPAPTLLLDSITYTNPASGLTDLDFTTDVQGFAVNQYAGLQTAEVIHH
jgi:hypothetical protein